VPRVTNSSIQVYSAYGYINLADLYLNYDH
jgi:hypothetical protein